MATIRRFSCDDFLRFASVNLDHLITTARMFNYLTWLAKWSDLCHVAVAPGNQFIAYILGATEEQSDGKHWENLVIEVNVASQYRRQGLATKLMQLLEKQLVDQIPFVVSPRDLQYLVCLFVGVDNRPAIKMFEQLGYEVNRSMPEFLSDNENTLCEFLYNDFILDNGEFISGNEEACQVFSLETRVNYLIFLEVLFLPDMAKELSEDEELFQFYDVAH